jgi:hypothetical protein
MITGKELLLSVKEVIGELKKWQLK